MPLANVSARSLFWPVVILLLVVALDQATKLWAVERLTDRPSIEVLGRFLMFTLVYNEGGAMGTQLGSSNFYLIVALLVIPVLGFYIWRSRNYYSLTIPLVLIIAGAVGNVMDRVRIGHVVDFIDVDIPDISLFGFTLDRFWTFNIADSAISCSLVFLLFTQVFFAHHAKEASPEPAPTEDVPSVDESH